MNARGFHLELNKKEGRETLSKRGRDSLARKRKKNLRIPMERNKKAKMKKRKREFSSFLFLGFRIFSFLSKQ